MKHYTLSVTAALITTLVLVVFGPWLISQPSNVSVFAGSVLLAMYPPMMWWLLKPVYQHYRKKLKETEEKEIENEND